MRSEWNFPYKADVLAMAGETKALYHLERRAWWAEKREETLTNINPEWDEETDDDETWFVTCLPEAEGAFPVTMIGDL